MTTRQFAAAVLAALLPLAAGCGRKADLDTPYVAAVDARNDAIANKVQPVPPAPQAPDPDKPFFLDFLLGHTQKPKAPAAPVADSSVDVNTSPTGVSTPVTTTTASSPAQ